MIEIPAGRADFASLVAAENLREVDSWDPGLIALCFTKIRGHGENSLVGAATASNNAGAFGVLLRH